jgi:hypothetical protein
MAANEAEFPDVGTVTVTWETTSIDGQPCLGWRLTTEPSLDPHLVIGLLRDVAVELELDLPPGEAS